MCLIWLLFLQIPITYSDQDLPVVDFEAVVPIVTFSVRVSKGNIAIQNLKKRHFKLKENQLKVRVANVEQVVEPKTIEFLIDLSSSNANGLQQSIDISHTLVKNMAQKDRARISAFSKIYLQMTPFSSDKDELIHGLSQLKERGSTALFDTISKALTSLSKEQGPKTLIVISDGRDLVSSISRKRLLAKVKSVGIPIQFIFSGTPPPKKANLLVEQYLFVRELVRVSGGSWFSIAEGPTKSLKKRLHQVGLRYLISYQPPQPENTDLWRRRELTIDMHQEYTLAYPTGYQLKSYRR